MTLTGIDDVLVTVDAIREGASDAESAHSLEDELWEAVLRSIAAGSCPDPKAWAEEAVRTKEIDFPRWCA